MENYNGKLCLSLSNTFNLSEVEQIEKIKNHGIDGFFALYNNDEQIYNLAEIADKRKIFFQSIHAKHHPMRKLWYGGDNTDFIMQDLISTIKCASKVGVDRVIIHAYTGFEPDDPTMIGLKRMGELLEVADKYGIKLCFENLEGEQFLDATLSEYKNCKYARMCYDCGHENCYGTHKVVDKFKDKIFALHINDNMGIRSKDKVLSGADDMHLVPFDGNVDFNRVVNLIKHANMQNELTFELKICKDALADKYRQMSFDDYLSFAKSRMQKVASML